MANTDEELIIKIKADTDKATKEISKLNKEVGTLTKQVNKSKNSLKGQKTAFDSIGTSTKKVAGLISTITLGLGALGVAFKGVEFANLASDAEQAADAFDRVITDMGKDSVKVFEEIKAAAHGLIPDAAIKQSATTALSLGVPLEKLAGLMEVARAKSREMGTDAKTAFEDLAKGIGRGSPMILDNLGLTIKLGEANKKMADSLGKTVEQLSKEEKTLALTNAVIESGAESVERYADAALTSKEKIAKMNTSLDNLKVAVGNLLLTPLVKLTEATTAFVDSIDSKKIEDFGDDVSDVITKLSKLYDMLKKISDMSMPDIFAGKEGSGVEEWANPIDLLIRRLSDLAKEFIHSGDAIEDFEEQVESTGEALASMQGFEGTAKQMGYLKESVVQLIEKQKALVEFFKAKDPVAYTEEIQKLEKNINDLKFSLDEMAIKNPFDKLTKGAEESAEVTKQYTESEIKEIGKLNDKRLKDTQKTISSLKSSEEKLAANIVNINKKLIQDLSKIADDRFNMNQDIQTRIAELERGGMSDDAAYYDRQKDAAKALADAKVALKEGEYEKYKSYLSEYESLITSSAGQEIKVNDRIAVSAEETRKRAIEGLKKIQSLENAYYDKKKSDAQTAHDLALQQSEIELSSIEAQLEAQKALLVVVKELTEAITGKTIDLDSSAIDAAIAKVKKAKEGLKTLSITPAKVTVDSRDVDVSKEKVEELKTLMINGVELEVKADTTPASFGIDKLITKVDGDEISMDVNPRYEAAQRELEAFRNGENSKPIEKTVEVDTDTPKQKMDLLVTDMEKPTTSTHTVDDNIEEVVSELSKMGEATTSTHTVDDNVPEVISDISTMKEPTTSTHTVTDNVPEVLSDIDEMKEDTDSTHTVEGNVEEIISELSTMENDTTSTHTVDDNVPDVLSDIVKMKKPTTSKHTVDDNVPQVLSAINRMKQSTGSRHTIDDNVPQVLREINKLKRTTHSNHIVHEKIIRARAGGGPIQHLAEGGLAFKRLVGKIPGHDTTGRDDVPIMGTRGEFMHPVSTVDHYGLSVMEKMRRKLIPKEVFNGYATGGLIKAGAFHPPKMPQHLASGGVVGASSAYSVSPALGDLGTLTLKVGGNDLQVLAPRDVAAALTTFINSEGGL